MSDNETITWRGEEHEVVLEDKFEKDMETSFYRVNAGDTLLHIRPVPKPLREVWMVYDNKGDYEPCHSRQEAEKNRAIWDEEYPSISPHTVVHMREVRDE